MTPLRVRMPGWLAVVLLVYYLTTHAIGVVCQVISARANLYYMESDGSSPPPPYPGQPAMQRTPERDADKKKDDGEGKKKKILPLRK